MQWKLNVDKPDKTQYEKLENIQCHAALIMRSSPVM
jgi:hypothetical protein